MKEQNKSTLIIEMDTPYVTINEFERRTGISRSAIRRLIREGYLHISKGDGAKTQILINMLDLTHRAAMSSLAIDEYLKGKSKRNY